MLSVWMQQNLFVEVRTYSAKFELWFTFVRLLLFFHSNEDLLSRLRTFVLYMNLCKFCNCIEFRIWIRKFLKSMRKRLMNSNGRNIHMNIYEVRHGADNITSALRLKEQRYEGRSDEKYIIQKEWMKVGYQNKFFAVSTSSWKGQKETDSPNGTDKQLRSLMKNII